MLVLGILAGVVVLSLMVGFVLAGYLGTFLPTLGKASYFSDVFSARPWPIIALLAIPVAASLGAFFAMTRLQSLLPPTDAAQFRELRNFGLRQEQLLITNHYVCPVSHGSFSKCQNFSAKTTNEITFAIHRPAVVPVRTDFRVSLEVSSNPNSLTAGVYSASLSGPKYIEGRTSSACKNAADRPAVTACDSVAKGGHDLELAWMETPNETGSAMLTVRSDLIAQLTAVPPHASAASTQMTLVGGETRNLNPDEPVASIGDMTIDLRAREIRFPVEIVTSIGVSQAVYDWARVGGAVLGGLGTLFGAGFALALVGKKAAAKPENGKENPQPSAKNADNGSRGDYPNDGTG